MPNFYIGNNINKLCNLATLKPSYTNRSQEFGSVFFEKDLGGDNAAVVMGPTR